jgi:hypothetical protein
VLKAALSCVVAAFLGAYRPVEGVVADQMRLPERDPLTLLVDLLDYRRSLRRSVVGGEDDLAGAIASGGAIHDGSGVEGVTDDDHE